MGGEANLQGEVLFKCTIPGRVRIKKNGTQRKYSFKHRRTFTCASDLYLGWENNAIQILRSKWVGKDPLKCPIVARFTFNFENRQHEPDLSNCYQGPEDALQKAGVIANDKLISAHDGSRKRFGLAPSVEIELVAFRDER